MTGLGSWCGVWGGGGLGLGCGGKHLLTGWPPDRMRPCYKKNKMFRQRARVQFHMFCQPQTFVDLRQLAEFKKVHGRANAAVRERCEQTAA